MPDHAELIAERDALVAELKERWPVLTAEIATLLRRLDTNRRHTEHAGVASAEAEARGLPADAFAIGHATFTDVVRLAHARIPQLDASTPHARSVMAWP